MLATGMTRIEGRLRALNLKPGALVCVALASPIRHLIVAAALFRLGHAVISPDEAATVVPLKLPIELYLQDAGQTLIVGVRQLVVGEDWFAGGAPPDLSAPVSGFPGVDALCCVEITSGSTGRPKAICSTLGEFNQRLASQSLICNLGDSDRLLALARLCAPWGFRLAAQTLAAGKTLVFAESARAALQMASVYAVETIVASTQQARDLVAQQKLSPYPLPSLRSIVFGGGLPSRALLTQIRAYLCEQAFVQYGASEVGQIAIGTADNAMEIEGATGFALPGVEIEIVDASHRPLTANTDGVVRVRTAWRSRPYPLGASHPGFHDGWFYPGDAGRLTPEGLLILSGRVSEVINSGGAKRAPEAIEDVVAQHPNVADVAAFGAMGPDGIEEIHLAVVARAAMSQQHLIDWCGERGIEAARVFFVDSLPRTPVGKIRREDLKRQHTG